MKYKSLIITLVAILSAICIYFLSFTFVSQNIKKEALSFATDKNGKISPFKKQEYIDSLWDKEIYLGNTLKTVTERELNLGLDLQGGMHVVLEVSPVEIIRGLSGTTTDIQINEALVMASKEQQNSQKSFVDLFYDSYKKLSGGKKLATVFANSNNRNKLNYNSSDEVVLNLIKNEVNTAVERAYKIIRSRVDKFGVANPNIQLLPGTNRIQVELPGVDNPERVRKLLSGAAKLEFYEVQEMNSYGQSFLTLGNYLLSRSKAPKDTAKQKDLASLLGKDAKNPASLKEAKGDSVKIRQEAMANNPSVALSKYFVLMDNFVGANVKDTAKVNELLARSEVRAMFPSDLVFLWEAKEIELKGTGTEIRKAFPLIGVKKEGVLPLGGDVITDASQDFDQTSRPEVSMTMNGEGARKWRNLTAANIGKRIAIVLDNVVYSAPNVNTEIPNGRSVISGNFTIEEAKDLANVLKAGKLPAPTRIVEDAYIGPSLGKQAINQGYISMALGLLLVILLMVSYYGNPGWVANVALLFNIFFIIGILAQLGSSLTLPGIAGIVLTMGMAVDANVLINERIREELRLGKGLLAAIQLGYDKAFSAIIDGNISTFLIGIILFFFGSGSVKGFAVTLMIGIITTIFTAVYISHVLTEWSAKRTIARGKEKSVTFDTFLSKNLFQNFKFDFIAQRKKSYIFSWVLIGLGAIAIIAKGGFNLGIDFNGGRSFVVEFSKPIEAAKVREALVDDFQNNSLEVKTFNGDDKLKITTSYLVNDESLEATAAVRAALEKGLEPFKDYSPTIGSQSKVGATIADDTLNSSFLSIFYSLIAIFIYILIRFRKWQYSLGGCVALLHDALVVLGMMGIVHLFGWSLEVDQVFIAAVLTVIGYSINDTVVVFDRIREYLGPDPDLSQKAEISKIINASINQTMSRTVMTASTVFLVVTVLLIFGGDVLRGFSFAMFVGCVFGTYSSIFVAAPIVVDFGTRFMKKPVEEKKV